MKHIFDVKTQTETIVELNEEELAEVAKMQEAEILLQAEAEAKATARAALLAQLGITEEQAKLLLG
jgi:hypothetical protein